MGINVSYGWVMSVRLLRNAWADFLYGWTLKTFYKLSGSCCSKTVCDSLPKALNNYSVFFYERLTSFVEIPYAFHHRLSGSFDLQILKLSAHPI
jgi:hypothetical protein